MVYRQKRVQAARLRRDDEPLPWWLTMYYDEMYATHNNLALEHLRHTVGSAYAEEDADYVNENEEDDLWKKKKRHKQEVEIARLMEGSHKRINRIAVWVRKYITNRTWWSAILIGSILTVAVTTGHEM